MAKTTVLVTAASGNVGTAVLRVLAKHADTIHVKAGVRDPSKNTDLAALGSNIEVVAADPANPAQFAEALKGVDSVYVIAPGTEKRAEIDILAVDGAKAAGVKFLLVLSVLTADHPETIFGKQFHDVEAHVRATGVPFCFIRLGIFLENTFAYAGSIKGQGAWYDPIDPEKLSTPVSVKDAGEVAAKILLAPDSHLGKTYELGSPPDTYANLAKYLSESIEKTITVTHVPYEAAKQAMLGLGYGEWMAQGVVELATFINNSNPVLNNSEGAKNVELLTGRPATTFKEWAQENAGAFK